MPIKAKYNGSYKDITDLMNVDESIDYVLAKTSSSYKRVYTATRSIEDAPPTTFKSIKPGANLTDYRIYGNTSKNILPLSKAPKTETIGDILCEYDGKGTFTFTSNVDNPTYTQDQWFWVPFEEDFDFPVGISDGGHGCIQLNNDFATEYGVTPYFVGFANRDNGEFVSGFNVAGTAPNIIDTNYEVEDLEGLPANCIAFLYLHQIGKRTVTIKPALYLDIRTQQPFEPYGESVGDRTGNLFDYKTAIDGCEIRDKIIYPNALWCVSDFIPVKPNTQYIGQYAGGAALGYSSKTSSPVRFPMALSSVVTTQSDTVYMRINCLISNKENVMLNEGSTALPYEPYGYKVPMTVEGINILPMSTTPISTDVDDFHCEYDGAGTITLTTDKDNAVLNNFSIPLSEDFIIPVSVGQGGNGCLQFNNSIATSANTPTDHISVNFYYNNSFIDGWGLTPVNRISSTYSFMGGKTINQVTVDIKGTGFSTNRKIVIRPAFVLNTTEQVPFEPYHAPVTTPIYLPEPIKMVGDEAEYIEYGTQKMYRIGADDLDVTLPALPTVTGTNVLSVGTEVQPSKIDITGHIKTISGGS